MNEESRSIGLAWLVPLRWLLLGGQLLAVGFAATAPGIELDGRWAIACIAVTAASNAALWFHLRARESPPHGLFGFMLVLDTAILTLLLRAGGGSSNPFSVLYLVHITLASLLLGNAWTYAIAVLSVLGFGALFLGDEHAHHMGAEFTSHLRGMWLAFTLTAGLTAAFVLQLTAAIRRRDREIERIREQAERTERLAALTTLAAGAAHELGSPLATIAVAAGELDRAVARMPAEQAASIRDDAKLIRDQLARCRKIIDSMTAAAGEVTGEAPEAVPVARLIDTVRSGLDTGEAKRLDVDLEIDATLSVPHRALARAISSLLKNSFDAGSPDARVVLSVSCPETGRLQIAVTDRGHGMPPDIVARATEPFFTTKPPGQGMGMGLFLARALVEQLGGRFSLSSTSGEGTVAVLDLPTAPGAIREPAR